MKMLFHRSKIKKGGGGAAGDRGPGAGLGAMSAEAARFDRGSVTSDGGVDSGLGEGGSPLYGACVQQRILITISIAIPRTVVNGCNIAVPFRFCCLHHYPRVTLCNRQHLKFFHVWHIPSLPCLRSDGKR